MSKKRDTLQKKPQVPEGGATRLLQQETQPSRRPSPRDWAGALFSPGAPQRPAVQDSEQPRVFDYAPGVNLYVTPRSGYGLLPFATLRAFAETFQYVRIVIEAFKREIRALEWDIMPSDKGDAADYSAEIRRLRRFWRKPDGVTEFDAWMNAVLGDMLEIDAVSLFLQSGPGEDVVAVKQIDGGTIRPLLDQYGGQPAQPAPAYVQVIRGMDWLWLTADRLLYRPFNTVIRSPYGRSPTEFCLAEINTALQRQVSALQYWNVTNVPEALVGLPDSWTLDQIKAYQEYFDLLMSGRIDQLRRIKFFPVDHAGIPVHEFRRPETGAGATTLDEWSLRVCCWAFGFLPSEFGLTGGNGLGGKGFMEGQENAMYRFGVGPVIQYIQNLITGIIERQTKAPLCFRYTSIGPSEDKNLESQTDERDLRNGAIDINVLRLKRGQPPVEHARPFIVIGNTPYLLDELFAPKPPAAPVQSAPPADGTKTSPVAPAPTDQQTQKALSQWRIKAIRRVNDGKSPLCDPPDLVKVYIPPDVAERVREQLRVGDIDKAFVFGAGLVPIDDTTSGGKKKFTRRISPPLTY